MNIQTAINNKDSYFRINREERNLAAIFYHLLLLDGNLKKFLNQIRCIFPVVEEEVGIYYEYAYLRDLWKNIGPDNDLKRKIILDFLDLPNRDELEKLSVIDFNKFFGASRSESAKHIASPANWSISQFERNIPEREDFIKVCRFKWCFNVKPDIVIHTAASVVICIETKFESKEGKYPSNDLERKIFKRHNIDLFGQLEIQKQLMEEIFGFKTQYIYLVQKKSLAATPETWTWSEVFANLDTSLCPAFIQDWLKLPHLTKD